MNAPAKLVELCGKIGARTPVWTQGAGGNVSVKHPAGNLLYVKASGTRLDQVSPQTGISAAALTELRAALRKLPQAETEREQAYAELLKSASLAGPGWGRLSMEAGFHALLPGTFVLHFHSLPALLMAHAARTQPDAGKSWLSAHVPFAFSVLPFVNPGAGLAFALADAPAAEVYLLENHGLVAQTEDPLKFLQGWEQIERAFCRDFRYRELTALLESADCLGRAQQMNQAPGAFAVVLPDAAVFEQRIRNALEPGGASFRLKADAWQLDRDACELWLATQILLRAAPDLSTLSAAQGESIARLPAEEFRKRR